MNDKSDLPKRIPFDHYATERSLIRVALEKLGPSKANRILDIGAGDGRWGCIAQELMSPQHLTGIDIRDLPRPAGFNEWYMTNFLNWQTPFQYDFIVSNPPYHIAEPIIRHAWEMLSANGTMMMLLRMAFQAGIKRHQTLWQTLAPVTTGICSRRPSFYGGGTNGTDYAIYVWQKDALDKNLGNPHQWKTVLLMYERERSLSESNGASREV